MAPENPFGHKPFCFSHCQTMGAEATQSQASFKGLDESVLALCFSRLDLTTTTTK